MKNFTITIRFLFILTLVTGIAYPLLITGIGQVFFKHQANGSLISNEKEVVGSELIAQAFANPRYFWPRPSAVKYDGGSSGASNASLTSADFLKAVKEREAQGLTLDLRFASASGLDPDISPESAESQLPRIASTRHLGPEQIARLKTILSQCVNQRQLGALGEPRVNVLRLNRLVDQAFGEKQ